MSLRPKTTTRILAAAWAVLISCLCTSLEAAGDHEFTLPGARKVPRPSGLSLHINADGIEANGYRPFKVTVATLPPGRVLTADRQVRIVLTLYRNGSDRKARVSQVIELPEGSSSVTATVLVPQMGAWYSMGIDTYEGGEKLLDLSEERFGWQNTGGWNWTEASPAILFIDSNVPSRDDNSAALQAFITTGSDASPTHTLPDVRVLLSLFPEVNNPRPNPGGPPAPSPVNVTAPTSDTALLWMLALRSRTGMIAPQSLPERWIELSQYDVALISLADLKQLAKERPKQLAALRNWASTGTLLMVYGVGERFAGLAELETLLQLPPHKPNPKLPEFRGWSIPDPQLKDKSVSRFLDETGTTDPLEASAEPVVAVGEDTDDTPTDRPAESKSEPPPFLHRSLALGCLVAIGTDKPFPGDKQSWNWIFAATGWNYWQWFRRTGFSLNRTNEDYWRLLIPGVGQAPVYSFIVLVSLFAIAIGPVNFFLLGRARRLYLLLITVPVGAVIVTLGLFVFAVVSDGLGMRLRIRSYTHLNQRIGCAAVWTRQSYYAGVAPSRGLHFPDDTAVFPVAYEPGANTNDRSTLLVWDGDQHLRTGYLSSRTATQLIVSRATTTSARLEITEATDAGSPAHVENALGTRIQYLFLCDSRGNYFAGTAIRDKAKTELKPIDLVTAKGAMTGLADRVKPEVPEGFSANFRNDNIFSIFGIRRYRFGTSDTVAGDPKMADSILEGNITNATTLATIPQQRTYIAILDHSPVVVTGVGPAKEEASFHVLRGRY